MDLETQRLENLKQKQQLLSDLKLQRHTPERRVANWRTTAGRPAKRPKLASHSTPARTSARIASSARRPLYTEDQGEEYKISQSDSKRSKHVKKREQRLELKNDTRIPVPIPDSEVIRAGWTAWEPSAKANIRDEDGILHFADFPSFTPNKTPEEVIREGCFGGSYFRPLKSRKLGILIEGDWQELPSEWHEGLDVGKYLTSPSYDPEVNKFKVACGQSIEEWEANGWIAYEHDIRGWFQWYIRFFMGRRSEDDDRQVSRWRKCVGETGRWRRMLLKKYLQMGVREVFDDGEEDGKEVSPVMHQTCHHWAYEVRQGDLDDAWSRR